MSNISFFIAASNGENGRLPQEVVDFYEKLPDYMGMKKIDQIMKLIHEMKDEEYRQGRADGIAALVKAAETEGPSVSILNGHANGHVQAAHPSKGTIKHGTMTEKIVTYVKDNKNQTAPVIVDAVYKQNPSFNPKSIRNTLDRLRVTGILTNEDKKWRVL